MRNLSWFKKKKKSAKFLFEGVFIKYCPWSRDSSVLSWSLYYLAALEEAREICTYLKPLQPFFEDLENVEFPNVKAQIKPLMHMVCLVWANSRYYNSPAHIIVLLQDTCNLLIHQVSYSQLLSTLWSVISHCRQRKVWRNSFYFLIALFSELKVLLDNRNANFSLRSNTRPACI